MKHHYFKWVILKACLLRNTENIVINIPMWSHDNSYVFYVKCGSTKHTFSYVFTDTKMYNTDVFTASKRTNTYAFLAFKHTQLTYLWHLNIYPYEYWNLNVNFIIIVVFSCHIIGLMFSIALLNCLLVYE